MDGMYSNSVSTQSTWKKLELERSAVSQLNTWSSVVLLFYFYFWSCVFEFNGRIHLRHPAGTQDSHDPDAQ